MIHIIVLTLSDRKNRELNELKRGMNVQIDKVHYFDMYAWQEGTLHFFWYDQIIFFDLWILVS